MENYQKDLGDGLVFIPSGDVDAQMKRDIVTIHFQKNHPAECILRYHQNHLRYIYSLEDFNRKQCDLYVTYQDNEPQKINDIDTYSYFLGDKTIKIKDYD